ncbi:MAG: glycoside hydrolase family 16 protein [Ignavibacteriae bacterium]|nr:glycoside hydrolase family 16 protein [Ignavibacteriota bacterium]
MKKGNLILLSFFISSLLLGCNSEETINDPSDDDSLKVEGFNLVWNDEFNIDGKPDESKWDYDIGGHGWGNNELQYYTSDSVNVRVTDGKLEIEAHYYPTLEVKYTSARIVTKNKGDWKYGRVEVKAKIPSGLGTWPAIWMLPTDWEYGGWPSSGEIDIMEHVGYDPNVIHGTVHTEAFNHSIGSQVGNNVTIPTAISDYHIYAIEWYEDRIDFYIDENKYFFFENQNKTYREWPFDKRFHLIMNIAFGGNWGGAQGIDNSIFPVKMDIDYVRVYEKID